MTKHNNHDICGFSFFNSDYRHLIEVIDNSIKTNKSCAIVTPTTEIIGATFKNKSLADLIKSADILLPDSITLVKLGMLFGKDIPERVTGVDTLYKLGQNPNNTYKVYYLGSRQDVILKTVENTKKLLPSFEIVGHHHGYFTEQEYTEIIADINKSKPDILFVGLGFPKQEKFIIDNKSILKIPIKITVGGSFDVIAGILKRAPKWMQNLGLEWAFRLIQEPNRLFRMSKIPFHLIKMYFKELNISKRIKT